MLDELAALGYLSDARFAKALVQKKSGAYSKRSIGATLKARGVSVEIAADAIDGSEVDDEDAMVALWRRRFGRRLGTIGKKRARFASCKAVASRCPRYSNCYAIRRARRVPTIDRAPRARRSRGATVAIDASTAAT